jgi:hypothetical protein
LAGQPWDGGRIGWLFGFIATGSTSELDRGRKKKWREEVKHGVEQSVPLRQRKGSCGSAGRSRGREDAAGSWEDPDWTRQTCRTRYQGPDLPKLMLVPPNPAWESSELPAPLPSTSSWH